MLVIFNHKSMLFIVVIIFFSFHITKKLTLKKLPPLGLKRIIRKLNLFLKLSIEKINGTSTPSGVKITFFIKKWSTYINPFKGYFQRKIYTKQISIMFCGWTSFASIHQSFFYSWAALFSLKFTFECGNIDG